MSQELHRRENFMDFLHATYRHVNKAKKRCC